MVTTTDGMNTGNVGVGAGSYPTLTDVVNGVTQTGKYLKGGTYALAAIATWGGGNVQLQFLAGDGATWVNVGASVTSNGMQTMDLPPGIYKFLVTTATVVFASLVGVPK
jgi:hypothetical protein